MTRFLFFPLFFLTPRTDTFCLRCIKLRATFVFVTQCMCVKVFVRTAATYTNFVSVNVRFVKRHIFTYTFYIILTFVYRRQHILLPCISNKFFENWHCVVTFLYTRYLYLFLYSFFLFSAMSCTVPVVFFFRNIFGNASCCSVCLLGRDFFIIPFL